VNDAKPAEHAIASVSMVSPTRRVRHSRRSTIFHVVVAATRIVDFDHSCAFNPCRTQSRQDASQRLPGGEIGILGDWAFRWAGAQASTGYWSRE
jgi:hypothetical protein